MEPREQLLEVQSVLDRLTKFRHLNGWAAVAAGILSIMAYLLIHWQFDVPLVFDSVGILIPVPSTSLLYYTFYLAGLLLAAMVICGLIVTISLPKDLTAYGWRNLFKLVAVYAVYIIAGAALAWALLQNTEIVTLRTLQTIPPMMCIFYGMSQLHAAQISLSSLKYFGFWLLGCGLLGCVLPQLSWALWAVGFGLGHIAIGWYVIKNKSV